MGQSDECCKCLCVTWLDLSRCHFFLGISGTYGCCLSIGTTYGEFEPKNSGQFSGHFVVQERLWTVDLFELFAVDPPEPIAHVAQKASVMTDQKA